MNQLKVRLKLLVLYIIYNYEEIHGYGIKKEIQNLIKGYELSPGSLYPILNSLQRSGLIEKTNVNHKKVYRITNEGKKYVEKHEKQIKEFLKQIDNFNKLYENGLKDLFKLIKELINANIDYDEEILEKINKKTKEYTNSIYEVLYDANNRG